MDVVDVVDVGIGVYRGFVLVDFGVLVVVTSSIT